MPVSSSPVAAAELSIAELIDEAADAGVVTWLLDRVTEDGARLSGPTGLLPALESAVLRRSHARTEPARLVVTWDPAGRQVITVDCTPGCTLAELRDVCLLIAATCTDLRPCIQIHRDGEPVQHF